MKDIWRFMRKLLGWLWRNRELVEVAVVAVKTANGKVLGDEARREVFDDLMPKVGSDSDRNLAREIGVKVLKGKW